MVLRLWIGALFAAFWVGSTSPVLAEGPFPHTRDGLGGFSLLPEAFPSRSLTLRAGLAIDYGTTPSFVYAQDDGAQLRQSYFLSFAPLDQVELAVGYRALDTSSLYNSPREIPVRGDSLFSLRLGEKFGDWAVGALLQGRHYVGSSGLAPTFMALAGYRREHWGVHAGLGWVGERWVDVAPVQTPLETLAWQKPTHHAVAGRIAFEYRDSFYRPFLEYGTEQYLGDGLGFAGSPHRLTPGVSFVVEKVGLVVTPQVDLALTRERSAAFPTDAPWRAVLAVAYEPPLRAWYQALFPPPGVFVGAVTDAATGRPVAGLQVTADPSILVEAGGRFRFEASQGEYALRLEAPDYLARDVRVRLGGGQLNSGNFSLERNLGTLKGVVYLGERRGAAWVSIEGREGPLASHARSGAFEVELAPGSYAMTVTAPGFIAEKRSFALARAKTVNFNRIALQKEPVVRPFVPEPEVPPAPDPVSEPPPAPKVVEKPVPAPAPVPEPEPKPVTPPAPVPVAAVPAKPPAPVVKPAAKPVEATPTPAPRPRAKSAEATLTAAAPPDDFDRVYFAFGSSEFTPAFRDLLEQLADEIAADPSIERVVIEGRADSVGTRTFNIGLADERAEAVYRFLVEKGVSPRQLATTITVYSRPAEGQSEDRRAVDRRVGFRVERRP